MKKIIVISLVLAMATGILLAQAPNRAAMGKKALMHGGRGMGQCMDELELTDAQSKKIEAARATFERQRNTTQAEIENFRMDIKDAIQAENFKRVKELNQQISTKQLQLKNARVDMIAAQMKELTKDQKATMQKYMLMRHGRGCGQGMMQERNRQNMLRSRRGPNPGRYSDEIDHCDDYDGVRKFRNRP
ncbi:MAG: hypothetical protein RBR69_09260 [Candidatus Cloacimonadaceae bacterium]|jgi:Spy/CpxP family protein refolding chaperone|nr:hypothetical protein [Candidatus Cloacimonadota bacterium]MDY0128303.1 hypothetical protein [Candidatus Cloacimonadaceae bacterium]MCB5254062.1 hypothetical protein [Candidatus Cloacimonadota bacterium]MCK9179196.1 hypothetical protein [Candidatus Cloacimonadota bacterium]MCK9243590.1 hypothetical protein [Candidatus Cloacimonadota bacterium]